MDFILRAFNSLFVTNRNRLEDEFFKERKFLDRLDRLLPRSLWPDTRGDSQWVGILLTIGHVLLFFLPLILLVSKWSYSGSTLSDKNLTWCIHTISGDEEKTFFTDKTPDIDLAKGSITIFGANGELLYSAENVRSPEFFIEYGAFGPKRTEDFKRKYGPKSPEGVER